ncbi:hypothetical protein DFP72DRAFT_898546 [Ephemerocybe angulata]|uniref:DUF6534 domain-containing protein n=1 Tax=Ephemerocybe angulata TaxID=980116 RepID=A0A8H6HYI9_9AGAR|nr:hypothetical protein DFP72DRAFT_898546 [Tulosesus angulatus]
MPAVDPGCIPRPTVDLSPYTGVEALGIFAAMALWGVTCMQTFLFFFTANPRDTWQLRTLVVWLWVMDTVHQCLLASGNFKATITGDTMNLTHIRTEYVYSILFTTLVSVPVQIFFSWRIWKLGKIAKAIFVGLLVPATMFQFVSGVLLAAFNSRLSRPDQITAKLGLSLIVAHLSVGAAVDIMVAALLCTLLWRTYLVNGITVKATTMMIHRLILFSINSGLWTAIFALLAMITAVRYPKNYIYIGIYFTLSPLYCNMLLANLNSRTYIRGGKDSDARNGIIDFSKNVQSDFVLNALPGGSTTSQSVTRATVPRPSDLKAGAEAGKRDADVKTFIV